MTSSKRGPGRPPGSTKPSKEKISQKGGLQILVRTNSHFDAEYISPEESPTKRKQKRRAEKRSEKPTKRAKRITIEEEVVLSDDDNTTEATSAHHSVGHYFKPDRASELISIFNQVGVSASTFMISMDSFSGVKEWLDTCHLDKDDERINEVEELCGTIAKLLRERRAPRVARQPASPGDAQIMPSEQLFSFRDVGLTVALLAPVEMFKGITTVKNKTFGKLRENQRRLLSTNGKQNLTSVVVDLTNSIRSALYLELRIALNLIVRCWITKSGPERKEVYRLMTYRDATMRHGRFESRRKFPVGTEFCSHCEPKLMLWFACHWLAKQTGKVTSIRDQVGNIFKINHRGMPKPPKAEIVLDRLPCRTCIEYKGHISEMTGIEYSFVYMPKTGKVHLGKDKYGNVVFPLCADEEDLESTDSETEQEDFQPRVEVRHTTVSTLQKYRHVPNPRKAKRNDASY
ncbi:hypothetical protein GLAREA_00711 [Glarea lozoyensis ATCC 20868]|uniref:Uncharacterized protein n=1 Tax=Glarea lozoyensis (strain ATCC 20868 / MF5171) TaxID=1116229 RepID=S3DC29_GLAL2|nr:uncharacterized protein GLAREA_00711 [Glarea lozoyensis ATCC 20868]EPE29551.1 hypothetical protein GLAREA_00711 [Glarea lozoyensis ATCC 20868]